MGPLYTAACDPRCAGQYCDLMSPPYVDTDLLWPHLYTYFLIYRHQKSVLIHNTSSFPGLNNFDFSFYLVKVIGIGYRSPYGLHLNYLNSCNLHTNVHLQLFGYLSTLNYSLYYTLNQSQENQCNFLAIN